ncbi:MAG TPA: NAD-dependent epimerase/dehydratase family protein, partial [Rubrivivax sp.]|nr:NAD-dependent epimerase/dehydratase family protein [Rubrivivax sp.]
MAALTEGRFPGATAAGPRHVLVTGGTGFIGHSLVPALAAHGLRVTVLSRRDRLPPTLQHAQVQGVRGLAEIPSHDRVDTVINLAGARILGLPWTSRRRQQLLRSRVMLTQELVTWIAERSQRPRCLLSASAIGYYGVQPLGEDAALTEDGPPQPVFMSQLCQQWEQAAAAAAPLGVRVACLRFGLVLGHGGALPMLLLPVRLGLGGRLGSGRQWLS